KLLHLFLEGLRKLFGIERHRLLHRLPKSLSGKCLGPRKALCFRLSFEYVRSHLALGEAFSELQPHEGAGRIAGRGAVVTFFKVGDHRKVSIAHERLEIETIVICDQRHWLSDPTADFFDLAPNEVDIFDCLDVETLEVHEQYIALGVVAEAVREAAAKERMIQPHGLVAEDAGIHRPNIADQRPEIHLRKNVALDLDAWCNFD